LVVSVTEKETEGMEEEEPQITSATVVRSREWPDSRPAIVAAQHALLQQFVGPQCHTRHHGIRSFRRIEGLYLPFERKKLADLFYEQVTPTELVRPAGIPLVVKLHHGKPDEERGDWVVDIHNETGTLNLVIHSSEKQHLADLMLRLTTHPSLKQLLLPEASTRQLLRVNLHMWSFAESSMQHLHFILVLCIIHANPLVQITEAVSVAVAIQMILVRDNRTMTPGMMELVKRNHTQARDSLFSPFRETNFIPMKQWYHAKDEQRFESARPQRITIRRRRPQPRAKPRQRGPTVTRREPILNPWHHLPAAAAPPPTPTSTTRVRTKMKTTSSRKVAVAAKKERPKRNVFAKADRAQRRILPMFLDTKKTGHRSPGI
jgi:hypothetical protein